jgi:signal transduction histidine kinase
MISQEQHHPPDLNAAAVPYEEVRFAGRCSRAALGAVLLVLAVVALRNDLPGALFKTAAAGLIILHAALDYPRRTPLAGLTLDGLTLCAAAGVAGEIHGPLIGAAAYILGAAILLVPRRFVLIPVAAVGAGVGIRLLVLRPGPGDLTGSLADTLAGIESGLYLLALGLMILGAARSVGLSRARQAAALEAEQRAAGIKNEFVSMVSHELRTPLTNIAGFALALRESWRRYDPAEVDEFLDVVCREAEHLRALVDDVLVVPRLEAGRLPIEPADFSLRPAAHRIAGLVFPPGGEKSISVSVPGNAVVHADPNRVEQVLRNLLETAARHGGNQVRVEAAPDGADWRVTVADDGPGITLADRERIFAAFEQVGPAGARGQGLGLGLTVSRVLVEAMGGRIWYENGFPTGARFCFTLPSAPARREAAALAAR